MYGYIVRNTLISNFGWIVTSFFHTEEAMCLQTCMFVFVCICWIHQLTALLYFTANILAVCFSVDRMLPQIMMRQRWVSNNYLLSLCACVLLVSGSDLSLFFSLFHWHLFLPSSSNIACLADWWTVPLLSVSVVLCIDIVDLECCALSINCDEILQHYAQPHNGLWAVLWHQICLRDTKLIIVQHVFKR